MSMMQVSAPVLQARKRPLRQAGCWLLGRTSARGYIRVQALLFALSTFFRKRRYFSGRSAISSAFSFSSSAIWSASLIFFSSSSIVRVLKSTPAHEARGARGKRRMVVVACVWWWAGTAADHLVIWTRTWGAEGVGEKLGLGSCAESAD